ncbi:MAG: MMPL family transporter [Candidatus Sericytochromatia bacterium]|nr:MMPL family transporter [Candidatus Sericytochromatia bacterium]
MQNQLLKLGNRVFKYKLLVVICWLTLILFSIIHLYTSKTINSENELSGLDNTEAAQAINIIKKDFGLKSGTSYALVTDNNIDTSKLEYLLKINFKQITKITEIKGLTYHKNKLLYLDIDSKYNFIDIQNFTPEFRRIIKNWSGQNKTKIYLTGNPAFHYDGDKSGKNDSQKGEIFALIFCFFVLIFTFGALVSALLPLIIGATTLLFFNSFIRLIDLQINTISQVMTGLLGLALAIDYSLFIVSRYREEISNGDDSKDAIQKIFMYPIKTIIVSSLIMICSISALLLPDVSTSRTVVYNIFIVISISLINSIIVLPTLLFYGKNILDKPEFLTKMIKRADSYLFWKKFAENIVNHPKKYFSLSLVILIILSLPVSRIKLWEAVHTITPDNTESIEGYRILENDGWGGELIPINIVIKANKLGGVYDNNFISYIYDFTKELEKNPKIASVQSITSWNKNYTKQDYFSFYSSIYSLDLFYQNNNFIPLINSSTGNDKTIINVYPKNLLDLNDTHQIIDLTNSYAKKNNKYQVLIGGTVARAKDFTFELYRYVPQMLLVIFLGIYAILFFYMKSIILPIKAGLMNFLPILSSFGVLTLIFQYKFMGNFFNVQPNSGVINMVPVILFCLIFGLSMDYEVLILSRITEAYEDTNNVKQAVIEGMSRSGSVITGAALILLAVFIPGAFSSSPVTKQICIGISSAIIIDSTIVRLLLVPSFMMLMGKWNWWNPFTSDKK